MSTPGVRLAAPARRAQLLEIACHLFAREGYRGTSMEAIAEAAGVTKPVLYQHFPSKHALYGGLLADEIRRLRQAFEDALGQAGDNLERLRGGFGAYIGFADTREDAFRLLFNEAHGLDATFQRRVSRFRGWVADLITGIIRAEARLPEARARALAMAIVGMAEGATTWWLSESKPLPAADLAEELAGLAWKGFARFPSGSHEADEQDDLP